MGNQFHYFDSGLAYARLSLLEEKAGNISEKEKAMKKAIESFQLARWKDYSGLMIREFLKKLDNENSLKKENQVNSEE